MSRDPLINTFNQIIFYIQRYIIPIPFNTDMHHAIKLSNTTTRQDNRTTKRTLHGSHIGNGTGKTSG